MTGYTMDFSGSVTKDSHPPLDADTFLPTEELGGYADAAQASANVRVVHTPQVRAQQKARQAARMRRFLTTCMFGVLYMIAVGVFYAQDMMDESTFKAAVMMVAGVMVGLYFVFASGVNQLAREKNLTLPIVICGLTVMLWTFYRAPETRIVFAPFASVSIAYAMYRLSQKTMVAVTVATLSAYAVIAGLHYAGTSDAVRLRQELLHLFALALTWPAYVILTGRVQRLQGALHKAGLKIRDIEEHARRDSLTNCFNRRYLVAALEQQKRVADENGTPLCLAVLDLDHFKRINDEVGHLAGDEVLRTFSRVALENIRSSDVFGRYGGEEFLLVLPETTLLAALNTAERIREQIEHHPWSGKLHGLVTVSIGLTQYITGESVLDLFSRTDTAMYLAKRGGRNQVVVEEPHEELWQSTGAWAQ